MIVLSLGGRPRRLGRKTEERAHALVPLVWAIVALVISISVLVLRQALTAKELADLISAFALLAWPVATVAIVYWLRTDIAAFLRGIKKFKVLGVNLERVLDAVAAATAEKEEREGGPNEESDVVTDPVEKAFREESGLSVWELLKLSHKIDQAARKLATDKYFGLSQKMSLDAMIRSLVAKQHLPTKAAEYFYQLDQVRKRVLRGKEPDDEEILTAIDSGQQLHRKLRSLLSNPRPPQETAKPETVDNRPAEVASG